VSEVLIEGPENVALRETAQFRVVARMTDGEVRDLTETAAWTGSRQVAFEAPGLVRGLTTGDAQIAARVESGFASKDLVVAPRGTYRLTGEVQETDSGPVVGAIVEVRRGVGAGLRVSTTVAGTFRMFGVAGHITLRVTNPGYEHVDQTVVVDTNQHVEIRLPLLKPRFDVAGIYTLTIAAADVCAQDSGSPLPDEARTRRYTAHISQVGATLEVALSGATFVEGAAQFRGRVEPGLVLFDLPWLDDELPSILERSPSLGSIVIDGHVAVTPSASGFAGRLAGRISLYSDSTDTPIAWCYSTAHRFVLSR
jgi:hypothetical protein